MGLRHVGDLGSDLGERLGVAECLNGVITIHESKTFLQQLKEE